MNDHPFFSIIIPTYNRAIFIQHTINSVLQQTYTDFEIMVIDDGSTDNTEDIVKNISDNRIIYIKKENEERGAARNYGAKKAKGKYVNFLDSDDLLYPNHLSIAHECIVKFNNPEVVYLNHDIKSSQGEIQKNGTRIQGELNKKLLGGNLLSCNGVFIVKSIALQYPFSENRKLSGTEDWLLWLRLASRYKICYSNTITSTIVQHDNRSVLTFNENQMLNRMELLLKELSEDLVFMNKWKSYLTTIKAHMLSYSALHLALSKESKKALQYLQRAVFVNYNELFTLRTLVTLKLVTMNYLNLR